MRQVLSALSAAAVVNLALGVGLVVYAASNHWLERDRLHRAWAALQETPVETTSQPTVAMEKPAPASELPMQEKIRRDETRDELAQLELDRRKVEVDNAWKLLETQQLALVREREAHMEDLARWEAQRRLKNQGGEDVGMKKELEILGGVKPKLAKELLRQKPEADAVAMLKAMEDRKVRKIVGECKNEEERCWIGRILENLHDRTLTQAEVLSGDHQN